MVIHRHSSLGVPVSIFPFDVNRIAESYSPTFHTKPHTVYGYLWGRWACQTITWSFDAESPIDESTLYPDVEAAFYRPSSSPSEVFDTLIRVAAHTLLVVAYFDTRLAPNPNLKRDFPHIPWHGEIAVLFVGIRKPFVSRAPPDLVVRSAIAR